MNLGERLKELRVEKGISQKNLAEIFNIARSTLSQYESNQRTPSDEIKVKLSEYFNVSLDYLLGKSDVRNYSDYENKLNDILSQYRTDETSSDVSVRMPDKDGEKGRVFNIQVKSAFYNNIDELTKRLIEKIDTLDDDNKKELEKFIDLLRLKEEKEKENNNSITNSDIG